MTFLSIWSNSKVLLFFIGMLTNLNTATDQSIECPVSVPADLSPCTFDSRYDPEVSCDYESEDCCPSGSCAKVSCQCILSAFACIVEPIQCQELCPETKPNSSLPCDYGIGIDCMYGDPIFCLSQDTFFYPFESVCYCFNATYSCNDFACLSDAPSASPLDLTTCPEGDPWQTNSLPCNLPEEETCNYDQFCCPDGDCVPHTTCSCIDGVFVCELPSVGCLGECPQSKPLADDVCILNPRYECEYDFGTCQTGDTATAATLCTCNFLDQTFFCSDRCNTTQNGPTLPSNTSYMPSVSPSDIPSDVPSDVPSTQGSIAPIISESESPLSSPAPSTLPVSPNSFATSSPAPYILPISPNSSTTPNPVPPINTDDPTQSTPPPSSSAFLVGCNLAMSISLITLLVVHQNVR